MSGREFRSYRRELNRRQTESRANQVRAQEQRDSRMDDTFMREAKEIFGGTGWNSDLGSYAASAADRERIHRAEEAAKTAESAWFNKGAKAKRAAKAARRAKPAIRRAQKNKSKGCVVIALVMLGSTSAAVWGMAEGVAHIVQAL